MERRYDDAALDDVSSDAGRDGAEGTSAASRAFAWLLVITRCGGSAGVVGDHDRQVQAAGGPEFHAGVQSESGGVLREHHEERAGVGVRVPESDAGSCGYSMVIASVWRCWRGRASRRWYWLGLNAGLLFGVGFCTWLQYQSLYEINALCLWCSLAWVATIVMFCYVTLHNIEHRIIKVPRGAAQGTAGVPLAAAGAVDRHHRDADPDPLVGLLDQLTAGRGALSDALA